MLNANLGGKNASPASLIAAGFSSLAHPSMSRLYFVQSCTAVGNDLQTLADELAKIPTCNSPDQPFQVCMGALVSVKFGLIICCGCLSLTRH